MRGDLQRRYGYFLQFCIADGKFDPDASRAAHVVAPLVEAYVAHAQAVWSPVTVHQSVRKLHDAARALAPDRDLSWLREIVLDLKVMATPLRPVPFATADALVMHGRVLQSKGLALTDGDRKATKFLRDGAMIALLAACPLREKNFARLELGRSIKFENSCWWIMLAAGETKSGRADTRTAPNVVVPLLETYLRLARPKLMKAEPLAASHDLSTLDGPIWFSRFGRPLDEQGLHIVTTSATREAFARPINPHAFRAAAATTASWYGADTPHLASALLQHGDPRVTDAHYNRVRTFEATTEFAKLLRGK